MKFIKESQPFINKPYRMIFTVGFFSSIVQIVLVRETIAVFSGNEIVLSIALAFWLLSSGIGSRISKKMSSSGTLLVLFFNMFLSLLVITGIRYIPRTALPGEVFSLLFILFVLIIVISPCSFLSGALFSILSCSANGPKLYRSENAGNIAGTMLSALLIAFQIPHSFIVLIGITALITNLFQRKILVLSIVVTCFVFTIFESATIRWKYPAAVATVCYGKSGELAFDTIHKITYLNRRFYSSEDNGPVIEQAVHVPLSIRDGKTVLLIQNRGHVKEINRYNDKDIVCIEDEPLLSDTVCKCKFFERLPSNNKFDFVILGYGLPDNISSNRYFTDAFFRKVHSMVQDSGLFSFTFELNNEYPDNTERKIINSIISTLHSNFKFVKIFQSIGMTFVASDCEFSLPGKSIVHDRYFTSSILPVARVGEFTVPDKQNSIFVNSIYRPILMQLSLKRYMNEFGVNGNLCIIIAAICIIGLSPVFIKSKNTISVGTTGFCIGIYSMTVMLLYQFSFGNLYTQITLLTVSLAAGFVVGGSFKKMLHSDLVIAIYVVISIFILSNFPHQILFFIANGLMGALGGAQFVTRDPESWGKLNAADLFGGVAGVLFGATVILPGIGVFYTSIMMAALKIGVALLLWNRTYVKEV